MSIAQDNQKIVHAGHEKVLTWKSSPGTVKGHL